ncbi:carboxylate-amine ligase [Parasphingorhabdus pacifica]
MSYQGDCADRADVVDPTALRPRSSGAASFGVEEEFLVADPVNGRTLALSRELLDEARTSARGSLLQEELHACQAEAATGVCGTLAELREQLVDARTRLGHAARTQRARLLSTGTPALGEPEGAAIVGERYQLISETYTGMIEDYLACGCHVHVGVPDRETAVAVLEYLRPWLPTLLALSVNSPYFHGRDTGHQSWRTVQQSRFPGSGVPPAFDSAAAYDAELSRLVDCGVLIDERMSFWLARLSPRFPTVEFRVADAASSVDGAVLQAGLSRAMVATALDELRRGRPRPAPSEQVLAAAVWSAARYGPGGTAVDPWREHQVPADHLVRELLCWVMPALAEAGDLAVVRELLERVLRDGSEAQRQRLAARNGAAALVDALTADAFPEPQAEGSSGSD